MEFILDKGLFPEWELVDIIGEGSFGKVYLIKKKLLNGEVFSALKVITIPQTQSQIKAEKANGMKDAEVTAYFQSIVDDWHKEIIFLDSLKGITNIVNIEDYKIVKAENEIRWDIYIRMEYVTNFNDIVTNEPVTNQDALKLAIDICQALIYCQRRKIIHRDIKPENIFRSSFGDYKLGDFGIARQVEKTNSSLSKKGTFLYMAPEVYNGQSYDVRADIYSLGLVLHKLFNRNQIPFVDATKNMITHPEKENSIQQRMTGTTIPNPILGSAEINKVILKAIAFNPKDRYNNPEDFIHALTKAKLGLENTTVLFNFADRENIINQPLTDYATSPKLNVKTSEREETEYLNTKADKQKSNGEMQQVESDKNSHDSVFLPQNDQHDHVDLNGTVNIDSGSSNLRRSETTQVEKPKSKDKDFPVEEKPEITIHDHHDLDTKVKEDRKKRNKIILPIIFVSLVLVISLVGYEFLGKQKYSMPNLVNTTVQQISDKLNLDFFTIEYTYVENASVEPGTIIQQSIEEKSKITSKKNLVLTVVKEANKVIVPVCTGLAQNNCGDLMTTAQLSYTFSFAESDSIVKGVVISSYPAEGSSVTPNTSVIITVSSGKSAPTTVNVPNGVGIKLDIYKAQLTKLGLLYDVKEVYSDTVTIGMIVSTDPSSGSVASGSMIHVNISKGKAPATTVKVPNGAGIKLDTYKTQLTKLGLLYDVIDVYSETVTIGMIVSCDPSSGSVAIGSTIHIKVSKGKAPATTVKVPNGVGINGDTYKATLTSLGLKYTVTQDWSETVATGVIVSQNPTSNTTVNLGSNVNIVISKGKRIWLTAYDNLPNGVTTTLYDILPVATKYGYSSMTPSLTTVSTGGWVFVKKVFLKYGEYNGTWLSGSMSSTEYVDVKSRILYVYFRYYWSSPQSCGSTTCSLSYKRFAGWSVPTYYDIIYMVNTNAAVLTTSSDTEAYYYRLTDATMYYDRHYTTSTAPYIGAYYQSRIVNAACVDCWYRLRNQNYDYPEYQTRTIYYTYYYFPYPSTWGDKKSLGTDEREFTRLFYTYSLK